MKICFVDRQWLSEETTAIQTQAFQQAGIEISFHDFTEPGEILRQAADADGIMVVAVPIPAEVINGMPNLKFIGRCGIGYDSVDLAAATARGIAVCNVPDYCAHEVAAHSFAMAMALCRQLRPFTARARSGGYGQGSGYPVWRLKGRVFGLLGYGRIARELAGMARGMGMAVAVYDPYVDAVDEKDTTLCGSLDDLLAQSDILSVHTPLTPETTHLIGMAQLRRMKRGAVLINTSRGPVIDTQALITALRDGVIAGAGLDVCEGEPIPGDHPLLQMENVIFTPHVAMYSQEAMEDLHHKITKQALDVLGGKYTDNIVNPQVKNTRNWKMD